MKKKIFSVLLILLIITGIAVTMVYNYRVNKAKAQKVNEDYKSYYNEQMLGTQLISIINKTLDINDKNQIEKDNKGYYIDNGTNSIHINVVFHLNKDDTKQVKMEDIANATSEEFIKVYSTQSFKCTDIQYHKKTGNVKSLTFEEYTEETK